jgi:hypothetical protein
MIAAPGAELASKHRKVLPKFGLLFRILDIREIDVPS